MKITIHLEIDEQVIADQCEIAGKTRNDFANLIKTLLEEDMGATIQDNEEVFSKKSFEIE